MEAESTAETGGLKEKMLLELRNQKRKVRAVTNLRIRAAFPSRRTCYSTCARGVPFETHMLFYMRARRSLQDAH
eukprot:2926579-Pyramimonas_sp.AAC.1